MYIGPWQEYNLSKKTATVAPDVSFRNDIEKAICDSLDPVSAKIALHAMNQAIASNQHANISKQTRPPPHRHISRNRKQNFHLLPSINTSQYHSHNGESRSARDFSINSPKSVRSTKSEPIQSTVKLPVIMNRNQSGIIGSQHIQQSAHQTKQQSSPNNVQHLPHLPPSQQLESASPAHITRTIQRPVEPKQQQPPYNAQAMVSLLRLERTTQAKHSISALTGWKGRDSGSDGGLKGGAAGVDGQKAEATALQRQLDAKIRQIEEMKQVYLSKSFAGSNNHGSSGDGSTRSVLGVEVPLHDSGGRSSGAHLSPIRRNHHSEVGDDEEAVCTPRIADLALTENEFLKISKYFRSPPPVESEGRGSSGAAAASAHQQQLSPRQNLSMRIPSVAPHSEANQGGRSRLYDDEDVSDCELPPLNKPLVHSSSSFGTTIAALGSIANSVASANVGAMTSKGLTGEQERQQEQQEHKLDSDLSNLDELYAGGLDGLLRWSAQLDFEGI